LPQPTINELLDKRQAGLRALAKRYAQAKIHSTMRFAAATINRQGAMLPQDTLSTPRRSRSLTHAEAKNVH
jgi:hypothetical protein